MSGVKHAWRCGKGHVHTDYAAALQCGNVEVLKRGAVWCKSRHLHETRELADACEAARILRRAKEMGLSPEPLTQLPSPGRAEQLELLTPLEGVSKQTHQG